MVVLQVHNVIFHPTVAATAGTTENARNRIPAICLSACRGLQFLLHSHDGYKRIHRNVDIIAEAHFTWAIPRPLGNRLRRSKSDAALAQALFVISETAIKGGGNAVSRPPQEPRSAPR
jgi:hypothetical protein